MVVLSYILGLPAVALLVGGAIAVLISPAGLMYKRGGPSEEAKTLTFCGILALIVGALTYFLADWINPNESLFLQMIEDKEYIAATVIILGFIGASYYFLGYWIDEKLESFVMMLSRMLSKEKQFHFAAVQGNTKKIEKLLQKGVNVNAKYEYNETALQDAATNGHVEVVKVLLENDADVNNRNNIGRTALISAVSFWGRKDIVRILLDNGADVNARDNEGRTALMEAPLSDKVDIVEMLLDNGADVNARDKEGRTALMTASEYDRADIVKGDVVPIFPLKLGSWYDRFARMPRGPRLDMEGVLHHVMVQGLEAPCHLPLG